MLEVAVEATMKSADTRTRTAPHDSDERALELALQELVATGSLSQDQATEVTDRFESVFDRRSRASASRKWIELLGYVGAGVVIVNMLGLITLIADELDYSAQLTILAGLTLLAASVTVVVGRLSPGGFEELVRPANAARRRLVGALGVTTAVLTSATMLLLTEQSSGPTPGWAPPVCFGTALLVVSLVNAVAPGTLVTLGFALAALATTIASLAAFEGAFESQTIPFTALMVLGMLGALGLSHWLRPQVFAEVLGLLMWIFTAGGLLFIDGSSDVSPDLAAVAVGTLGLVGLMGIGAWRFHTTSQWHWAAGAALAVALLVNRALAEALGGALALIGAGVVLVALSVMLLRRDASGGAAKTDHAQPTDTDHFA